MIRQALLEYRLPVVKQDERRFEFAAVQRTVVKKQIDLRRENFDLCAGFKLSFAQAAEDRSVSINSSAPKRRRLASMKKPPCMLSILIRRYTERKISGFYEIFENERREARKTQVSGGDWSKAPAFSHSPIISSSTIFVQRSMLSAAICSYGPWKAKPPVQRFGVGRPM